KYADQVVYADQNSGWAELTISGTSEVLRTKFTEQEHAFPQAFQIRESVTGNVHEIDVTAESGEVGQGIFELTGDKLRRAMSLPGGHRPTEFAKPGQVYSVWKRVAALSPPTQAGKTLPNSKEHRICNIHFGNAGMSDLARSAFVLTAVLSTTAAGSLKSARADDEPAFRLPQ